MVTKPKVTVGTLCYNTGPFVVQALECVKRQNYVNIEHIIIDDASPDGSADLLQQWIDQNNYPCIFIKRPVNKGIHENLRDIFSLGTGKYLAMISDDLWNDHKLVEQVNHAESLGDEYAIIYGDTAEIDEHGNILNPSFFDKMGIDSQNPPKDHVHDKIISNFFFYIQASLIRFDYLKFESHLNENDIISEDWDWQLALSKKYKFYGLSKTNAFYRIRSNSITQKNWIPSKVNNVLTSQAKMLLNYVGDQKYDMHIFKKVLQLFQGLNQEDENVNYYRRKLVEEIYDKTGLKLLLLFKRIVKYRLARKLFNRIFLPSTRLLIRQ